jgi:hypothetical protein
MAWKLRTGGGLVSRKSQPPASGELLRFSLEPDHEQASIGNKSLYLPHYTLQLWNYSLFLSILTSKEA